MTVTESPVREHYDDPADIAELSALVPDVEATVRRWLAHAQTLPVDKAAARLAAMLNDPRGLAFTVGFVDGVIRPEDVREAARTFAQLARDVPGFLPWHLRAAVKVGARVAKPLPWVVIPAARRVLRRMVRHLVVDATDKRLGAAIRQIRGGGGTRLNLNLLGEAILGEDEAARRLEGTRRLLVRDDVDYVSIKVSATVAPHSPWAFDEAVRTPSKRSRRCFARRRPPSPRSSSTWTWRSTATSISRSRCSPVCSTSRSSSASRRASCCRRTCRMRSAR